MPREMRSPQSPLLQYRIRRNVAAITGSEQCASVRDLWSRKDLGQFGDSYTVKIPPHGSMLIRVSGESGEKH